MENKGKVESEIEGEKHHIKHPLLVIGLLVPP
jgi:hypothetical protein